MKYYSNLVPLRIFSLKDAVSIIGNEDNAKNYLVRLCKDGKVRRIKKCLYSIVDLTSNVDLVNQYVIASHITDDAFISYHSAFEFYGFYNQVYTTVQVSSITRFSDFHYGDYRYKFIQTNNMKQVDVIKGAKVTSIERTIVDSINMLGKVMDVEELVKCIDFVRNINVDKIKEMLEEYDKDILYRKVGYILSFFKDDLKLDDEFFEYCKSKSNVLNYGSISYGEIKQLEFISEWGLYAYKDLSKFIDKGGISIVQARKNGSGENRY